MAARAQGLQIFVAHVRLIVLAVSHRRAAGSRGTNGVARRAVRLQHTQMGDGKDNNRTGVGMRFAVFPGLGACRRISVKTIENSP